MASTCFCGCGSKVKFSRRAFNGTGALVRRQLEAWNEKAEYMRETAWPYEMAEFVRTGEEMDADLQRIAHGGPVFLTHPQRAITKWLAQSPVLLSKLDAAEALAFASALTEEDEDEGPASLDPEARRAREAEIEAIRQSYESPVADPTACPECGAAFDDNGALLAHVATEHGSTAA
jgi:hypothetical protein